MKQRGQIRVQARGERNVQIVIAIIRIRIGYLIAKDRMGGNAHNT